MNKNRFEELLGFDPKSSSNELYALCDFQTLQNKNISLERFLELCSKFDAKIIQYRDKFSNIETKKENLFYLKSKANIPIIINDEIALVQYCDGLHLGQEDFQKINSNKQLVVKLIRKKIGNKLLGLSTHNEKEILEANNLDLDMIGLGAYRTTTTKDVSVMLGNKISYLAKISKHPVCAIGGVKIAEPIANISFNVVGSSLYD
ncbi:thiamine phosphate synthase [Arcobacter sp.]|uniref:thiamine phosphate synthase n=1 Tax=unclassified Arcobacter TaxID=2593671 RepID=UPI003B00A883